MTSIRNLITLSMMAAILSVALLSVLAGSVFGVLKERDRIREETRGFAGVMADRLAVELDDRVREITRLADLVPQAFPVEDDIAVRFWLEQVAKEFEPYAWIGAVDPTGRVWAATDGALEGRYVDQEDWFRAALTRPVLRAPGADPDIGERLSEHADETRLIDVAAPLRTRDGVTLGALGAQIRVSWLDALRRSIREVANFSDQNTISILDHQGAVILAPASAPERIGDDWSDILESLIDAPSGEMTTGRTITGRTITSAEPLVGSRPVTGLGWTVIVERPTRDAFDGIWEVMLEALLVFAVCGIVAVLLSIRLGRRIAQPIVDLSEQAQTMALDRGQARSFTRLSGLRELVLLSQSLRNLVVQLEQSESDRRATQTALSTAVEEAETDPMTGILNRRGLYAQMKQAGSDYAVILFDIDHFKRVNDTLGHDVGDRVIIAIAGVARALSPEGVPVARMGGEEFLVALPGADLSVALDIAEKLRRKVAQTGHRAEDKDYAVTVSLGVAVARPGEEVGDVIGRADDALYRAKNGGRNRVAS